MSIKRRERKQQDAIDQYVNNIIYSRVEKFTRQILKGYQERVNKYLKSVSMEMLDQVGYSEVKLQLVSTWKVPTETQREIINKTRKAQVSLSQPVFFCILRRNHISNKETVEVQDIWSSVGFQTEGLKTKKEVEIILYESLIGYMAEKGIEYIEAERIHRQQNLNQSHPEVGQGKSASAKNIEQTTN